MAPLLAMAVRIDDRACRTGSAGTALPPPQVRRPELHALVPIRGDSRRDSVRPLGPGGMRPSGNGGRCAVGYLAWRDGGIEGDDRPLYGRPAPAGDSERVVCS